MNTKAVIGIAAVAVIGTIVVNSLLGQRRAAQIEELKIELDSANVVVDSLEAVHDSIAEVLADLDTVPTVIPEKPVAPTVQERVHVDTLIMSLPDTVIANTIQEQLDHERAVTDSLFVVVDSLETEVDRLMYNYSVLFDAYTIQSEVLDALRIEDAIQRDLIKKLQKNQKPSMKRRLLYDGVKVGLGLYAGSKFLGKKNLITLNAN